MVEASSCIMQAAEAQPGSSNYRTFRAIISDNGYGQADKLCAEGTQVLRECITAKIVCRATSVYELPSNPRCLFTRPPRLEQSTEINRRLSINPPSEISFIPTATVE